MRNEVRILDFSNRIADIDLKRIIDHTDAGKRLILITETYSQQNFLESLTPCSSIEVYDDIGFKAAGQDAPPSIRETRPPRSMLIDILQRIQMDGSLPLFFDRENHYFLARLLASFRPSSNSSSLLEYYRKVTEDAQRFYELFSRTKPNYIVYSSTPHARRQWVSALVAKEMGCQSIILQNSAVPGFYKLCVGLRRERRALVINEVPARYTRRRYKEEAQNYIDLCLGKYSKAMAAYERERIARNRGRIFTRRKALLDDWHDPASAANTIFCWRELKRLSTSLADIAATKFVVFFLHFQPERKTLPEGFGFTQMLNVVTSLRAALPSEVKIVIKEHPSTFTNRCRKAYRSRAFYRAIDRIENSQFVDIETDNFELLDRALCVATLTGTVGVESLIRGTPVVYFGVPPITSILGQHIFMDGEALSLFLGRVVRREFPRGDIRESARQRILDDERYVFQLAPRAKSIERKTAALEILATATPQELLIGAEGSSGAVGDWPKKHY